MAQQQGSPAATYTQEQLDAAVEAAKSHAPAATDKPATKGYELAVAGYHDQAGTKFVRGDKIQLTEDRATEFLAAGVVVDPKAKAKEAPEPGGQTRAPKGD